MDELIVTAIINLGVAGIFIILYMRLWTLYVQMQKDYLNDLRDLIRKQDIDAGNASQENYEHK